ncbi:cobalt-precorrin-4 C(11)-methyltransferase [Candidatus Bathyarchaeota archaeon]|nr:MAG: cobalt-precorrin-4 C(11)-methyltransferase [Candidatus Bathyarchaeota archaeon]
MTVVKVYFIGFGPGDPELLTIKAYKILKRADLIIYPGSLIDEKFLEEFSGRKVSSYGMKLEEIIELIESNAKAGKTVVRVVSGDPSIFSALNEQIFELSRRGLECEVIPGISSISSATATLKVELTTPSVSHAVAILRPAGRTLNRDYLEEFAKIPCTIVILLGIEKIEEIAERVGKIRGWDEPVAVVYHASRGDEKIVKGKLGDIAEKIKKEKIRRTSVIIIGKVLEKEKNVKRCFLYA